jgi:hypothetical protein
MLCLDLILKNAMNRFAATALLLLALSLRLGAGVRVDAERTDGGPLFKFAAISRPASNDAASTARFALVDGTRDRNGGPLDVLRDDRLPDEGDRPAENFFFRAGTDGGRILIDLGKVIPVKRFSSYSWHTGTRAPQFFKLFASDGGVAGFNEAPKRGTDPLSCGWKLLATVDTRARGGGQHGVAVTDSDGVLGKFRFLLMDIAQTESDDPFGNTFFSEIDVVDADGPEPAPIEAVVFQPVIKKFATADGKFHFTLDATVAPDLAGWSEKKLQPAVLEWYPKLVEMLPGEGFRAATNVTLRYRTDMGGTPASAGGARVNLNAAWFRRELDREAVGSVIHELVHVVQAYGQSRRREPDARRAPGWIVEGIPDYIRWFLYEPQTRGAEISARALPNARYDASYRVTGNFLDWVSGKYDKNLVRKLNAAAREGRYNEQLWKDWTGRTVQELGDEWKAALTAKLKAAE